MRLKKFNNIFKGLVFSVLISNYCLLSVYRTSSPTLVSRVYKISTRYESQLIPAKKLGFGSPAFDPSCNVKNSFVKIDGEDECQGSQIGNYLASLYLSVLRSQQRNNSFTFFCGNESATIFSKLNFDLPIDFQLSKDESDLCITCKGYAHVCETGLNHALSLIKYSFRSIEAPKPLDDVTIHFRCGDILSLPFREYGYPRYKIYKRYLSRFNTLGVLAAPLDKLRSRNVDHANIMKCRDLLSDMVEYFISEYPDAKITVRNNDSLEEAFGRLLHSAQTWCNPSTFCLFPTLVSNGNGYILETDLYPFVRGIKSDHITIVKGKILSTRHIVRKRMTADRIKAWLRS